MHHSRNLLLISFCFHVFTRNQQCCNSASHLLCVHEQLVGEQQRARPTATRFADPSVPSLIQNHGQMLLTKPGSKLSCRPDCTFPFPSDFGKSFLICCPPAVHATSMYIIFFSKKRILYLRSWLVVCFVFFLCTVVGMSCHIFLLHFHQFFYPLVCCCEF